MTTYALTRGVALEGNRVQENVFVEVRQMVLGYPLQVPIYASSDGSPTTDWPDGTKSNPFFSNTGEFEFYATGGFYRVHVYKTGFTKTWDNVPVGTAQGLDAEAFILTGSAPVIATTRSVLKLVDTTTQKVAYLSEAGREGTYVFRSGDYSAAVAADTDEAVYIKATAVASSAGAWVLQANIGKNIFLGASDAYTTNTWMPDFGAVPLHVVSPNAGGGNVSASIASVRNTAASNTLAFPTAVTGYGRFDNAGNTVFGGFFRADQHNTGVAVGAEIDAFNYYGAPSSSLPPDKSIGTLQTQPIALAVAAGGDYNSSIGIQLDQEGGAPRSFLTGIYFNPKAAVNYGIYLDATATDGPTVPLQVSHKVTAVGAQFLGVGTPVAANSWITYQDGSGNITFAAKQSGSLVINKNTAAVPTIGTSDDTIHINAANSTVSGLVASGYGANATIIGSRASGTGASPTAVTSGASILTVGAFGYGATGYSSAARASVQLSAAETWTDTAQGTQVGIRTTPTGSTTTSTTASFSGSGALSLGVSGSIAGSVVLSNATSGTITVSPAAGALGTSAWVIPVASDTFVGKATTDTLTNKTISGASNTITNVSLATGVTGQLPIANIASNIGTLEVSLSVNFNSGNTDNALPLVYPPGCTRFIVNTVRISGASASLTTATFGVFTAAAGGGTAVVTSASAITVSTASDNTLNNAQSATINNAATTTYNVANLYFRVQTAQGSAATGTVTLVYVPLP